MRLLSLLIAASALTVLRADPEPKPLGRIVVTGRQDSLLGVADSATIGVTGAVQLGERPLLRPGEVLETVPGLIITQHAGGGKANQYFMRGFNLDHGTDFATFLDGVPLNMPSHGHGQGYADMNFVIPELIERVNYQKGPYYAQTGDFGTAGAAYLETFRTLPKGLLLMEGGSFNHARLLVADSRKVGAGDLLYAVQGAYSDGPWLMGDNYRRANGQLSWSRGDGHDGFSTTLRFYQGEWRTSDQIPLALVESGALSRWGNMDPTNGGDSRYLSWSADWRHRHGGSEDRLQAYLFRYELDLFSNFTYALDAQNGDQFEQQDARTAAGFSYVRHVHAEWDRRPTEASFGVQFRHDWIENGLYLTDDRVRHDTTSRHELGVGTLGVFAEHRVQWTPTFRSVVGGRGDLQFADVNRLDGPADSGNASTALFTLQPQAHAGLGALGQDRVLPPSRLRLPQQRRPGRHAGLRSLAWARAGAGRRGRSPHARVQGSAEHSLPLVPADPVRTGVHRRRRGGGAFRRQRPLRHRMGQLLDALPVVVVRPRRGLLAGALPRRPRRCAQRGRGHRYGGRRRGHRAGPVRLVGLVAAAVFRSPRPRCRGHGPLRADHHAQRLGQLPAQRELGSDPQHPEPA
ncbi:MAG: hypothetical protein EBR70_02960 [Verrucomicrobia bacterium]|nr:hypothetical protein [Verrucomicrobiota bacterium]